MEHSSYVRTFSFSAYFPTTHRGVALEDDDDCPSVEWVKDAHSTFRLRGYHKQTDTSTVDAWIHTWRTNQIRWHASKGSMFRLGAC